ncbi:hypothetical protein, partial [Burkholderia sp. BCC1640]|uniref:hypothetical protein n=1 Tax=Burkholderia sp. BCC1640 TaxID=2676294 RepID=UPI001ABBD202
RRTTTPETHTLIHNRSCYRPVSTPAQNPIGPVAQNSVGADITEYLLALCASQIIYLVDLENSMEVDIPF